MPKKETSKSSTKKRATMPAAPKPMTVTPPSGPRHLNPGSPTPPPPPNQSVGVLAVTPPSAPKRILSQEFMTASEKAREKIHRKQSTTGTGLPGTAPPTEADGLHKYADCERMALWNADVRVLLAVTEVISRLVLVPEQSNSHAALRVRKDNSTAQSYALLDITRPNSKLIFETTEKKGGIGDVASWDDVKKKRLADADVVVSADKALGSLLLSGLGLDEAQAPKTSQLVRAVIEITAVAVHWLKDRLVVPRPYELTGLGKSIDPVLEHPGHSSYPGGHAAQAAAVAHVLNIIAIGRFDTQKGSGLDSVAELVATSRLIAGLHYPIDNNAGREVGKTVGKFLEGIVNMKDTTTPVVWEALTITQEQGVTRSEVKEIVSAFPKLNCLWSDAVEELKKLD